MLKFHDAAERPLRGGWHYWENLTAKTGEYRGFSPDDVFAKVKAKRSNNGQFNGDNALWAELWAYWCSLEPQRCVSTAGTPSQDGQAKEQWGPRLWMFLNHAAVNFERPFFIALVNEMIARLIPCPECRDSFARLVEQDPVSNVTNARMACEWSNRIHNAVRVKLGQPEYPYERMIAEYGAPL